MKTYEENNSIKYWSEEERPREKLLLKGKSVLTNAELIAILIGSGTATLSAVEVSRHLLKEAADNLIELSKMSVTDLQKTKGIGEAKAISIVAALELGKRRRSEEALSRRKIVNSKDAFEYMQITLSDTHYESFWILLLNRANRILKPVKISEGGMTGTVADPKRIFKTAIDSKAASIVLCHNHPSGSVKPSDSDINLTQKLKNSGEILQLPVIDHLIMGDNKYFSFADEGMF
ncbi:MAG: DNA repair protein RadC [Bacteroidales bacterium]|nr:DNA repair protein RadC [Bacteroidales bacterium]